MKRQDMLVAEVNIYEVDVDGPPAEAGHCLFWLDAEGFMLYNVTDEDLDAFDDNFDGTTWTINHRPVIAYAYQDSLELGYI